jgi:hypothetical protein
MLLWTERCQPTGIRKRVSLFECNTRKGLLAMDAMHTMR